MNLLMVIDSRSKHTTELKKGVPILQKPVVSISNLRSILYKDE